VFLVRDLDATVERVKQANVTIATPGQKPVPVADGARAVLIRDLDNRLIELRQPANATSTGDITDLRLSIAVSDLDRTTRLYRDVLGFTVEADTDAGIRALTGLSTANVRRSRVQAPGSTLWIEFVEYKGVERTPMQARIQDRGAARLQLRVQNIDDMVATMKNAGMTVVSQGGGPVPIPPNFKGALVGDFDNFFVTPFEPAGK
jgi:catechol 2,3-dioxygenase-like lactoylglutathione lyase family enzyme